MKKTLSRVSAVIFFINLLNYVLFITGIDIIQENIYFPVFFGGSVLGLLFAFTGEKNIYRKIGMWGNLFIVFLIFILPFIVTTFFWNEP